MAASAAKRCAGGSLAVEQPSIYQSGEYLRQNESWHEEDADYKFRYLARLVDKHGLSPKVVLDAGCGTGRGSRLIAEHYGARVDGFDVSPQAIARARELNVVPLVRYHQAPIEQAPSHYDLGVSFDVFEHIDDYVGFLRELRRHAPRWIMHIPLDLNVFSVVRDAHMTARSTFGHLHYFSETSALATLEYCGYSVRDVLHTPGFRQHMRTRPTLRSMPALLPRMMLFRLSPRFCARWLGGVSLMVLADAR